MGSPAVVNLGVCIDCATIHKVVHTERAIWLLQEADDQPSSSSS